MKETMRAAIYDFPGPDAVLAVENVPRPGELGPDDVRIAVRATAVNRADILQRRGFYPPPPGVTSILGLECTGLVTEVGRHVTQWKVGDRVMALLPGGGYAEEAVVDTGSVMRAPEKLSDTEAGAFPEVFLTAFLNIFLLGEPPEDGVVLVHGGGSGVGTAAITLCREAGLRILVTAGSDEKCERCLEHGAHVAINYRVQSFADAVSRATGGQGVDVVLDSIGAQYLEGNLACLATGGRLIAIGSMGGARKAEIDFGDLLRRRLRVIGSTLRSRPVLEKAALVAEFQDQFGGALAEGRLRPVVGAEFPLEQAIEAHRLMESSKHFGKIALKVRE